MQENEGSYCVPSSIVNYSWKSKIIVTHHCVSSVVCSLANTLILLIKQCPQSLQARRPCSASTAAELRATERSISWFWVMWTPQPGPREASRFLTRANIWVETHVAKMSYVSLVCFHKMWYNPISHLFEKMSIYLYLYLYVVILQHRASLPVCDLKIAPIGGRSELQSCSEAP